MLLIIITAFLTAANTNLLTSANVTLYHFLFTHVEAILHMGKTLLPFPASEGCVFGWWFSLTTIRFLIGEKAILPFVQCREVSQHLLLPQLPHLVAQDYTWQK